MICQDCASLFSLYVPNGGEAHAGVVDLDQTFFVELRARAVRNTCRLRANSSQSLMLPSHPTGLQCRPSPSCQSTCAQFPVMKQFPAAERVPLTQAAEHLAADILEDALQYFLEDALLYFKGTEPHEPHPLINRVPTSPPAGIQDGEAGRWLRQPAPICPRVRLRLSSSSMAERRCYPIHTLWPILQAHWDARRAPRQSHGMPLRMRSCRAHWEGWSPDRHSPAAGACGATNRPQPPLQVQVSAVHFHHMLRQLLPATPADACHTCCCGPSHSCCCPVAHPLWVWLPN